MQHDDDDDNAIAREIIKEIRARKHKGEIRESGHTSRKVPAKQEAVVRKQFLFPIAHGPACPLCRALGRG